MRTKFTPYEWRATLAHENLFDLSKEELYLFRLIIKYMYI